MITYCNGSSNLPGCHIAFEIRANKCPAAADHVSKIISKKHCVRNTQSEHLKLVNSTESNSGNGTETEKVEIIPLIGQSDSKRNRKLNNHSWNIASSGSFGTISRCGSDSNAFLARTLNGRRNSRSELSFQAMRFNSRSLPKRVACRKTLACSGTHSRSEECGQRTDDRMTSDAE